MAKRKKENKIDKDVYDFHKAQIERISKKYEPKIDWRDYYDTDQTIRDIFQEEMLKKSEQIFNNFFFYFYGILTTIIIYLVIEIFKL